MRVEYIGALRVRKFFCVAADGATAELRLQLALFEEWKPDGIAVTFCHGKVSSDVKPTN